MVTGVVWMTSVMRSNFEKKSQFICLDSMMKKTNKHLMPYMSVVIIDDLGNVQVCCEALMIGETFDAYMFMLNACFRMAPSGRCRKLIFFPKK